MMKKLLVSLLAASMVLTGFNMESTIIYAEAKQELNISVVSTSENNLYTTLVSNYDGIERYDSFEEALENADDKEGIMVLADQYPTLTKLDVSEEQLATIKAKGIRLYVEYPEDNAVLGIDYGDTAVMGYDRGIIVDGTIDDTVNSDGSTNTGELDTYSLLYVHGARYVSKAYTSDMENVWMVNAKVAGYDDAVFGLTNCSPYVMIETNDNIMVASTKLSQFISARYAPYARWQSLWMSILGWVSQTSVTSFEYTPLVNPHYSSDEEVDLNDYKEAVKLNTEWYKNTGFIMSDEDEADYMGNSAEDSYATGAHNDAAPVDRDLTLGGDGSNGVLEAFVSGAAFTETGDQLIRFWRRADCNGESAGNIALAGVVLDNDEYKQIALNVVDWLLTESFMSQGDRANPNSAQYGLLTWHDGSSYVTYYGDDNAKAVLGLISAVSALRSDGYADEELLDQYDKRILEVILGNFRTTSTTGLRGDSISGSALEVNGWEYYYNSSVNNYAPHFEALNLATYLWAYDKSGYTPLLERTKTGIKNLMDAYHNNNWKWTNGLQQERAKMILPLAWLVRIEDTEEHRAWLDEIIEDLMKYRDEETGAIADAFGEPGEGTGMFGPFTNNSQYGLHEAPVIQENGDPCIDALYTSSFAMMTLNEAYAATSDATLKAKYKEYSDSLSDFFVRIQQVSENDTYNGVWFRGFDYEKWETYGSDGDAAWGVWCTETGWSQAWISNTLSMKVLGTNIWDYTQNTTADDSFVETATLMLNYDPNDLADPDITATPITVGSAEQLLDGVYGSTTWNDGCWIGVEGKDVEINVDLQEVKTIDSISLNFLDSWTSGARVPSEIEVLISEDGVTYTSIGTMGTTLAYEEGNTTETLTLSLSEEVQGRYLQLKVKNPGNLPVEHPYSNGGTVASWMFMDELTYHISQATISDLYEILAVTRPLLVGAYTEETGSALASAREEAEAVYAKENPTKEEIHTAYTNLKEAYEALESDKVVVSMTSSTDGDSEVKLIDREYATDLNFQNDAYIGWQNTNTVEAIIDLKEVKGISSIGFSALSRPAWGIYVPSLTAYVSENGTDWEEVGSSAAYEHQGALATPEGTHPSVAGNNTVGRYVKYVWTSSQEWMFIDEVEIETYEYTPASIIDVTNLTKADVLLDGEYGFVPLVDPWRDVWAEYEGANISFTLDLGQEMKFDTVKLGFLQAFASGICTPETVKISVSKDNVSFSEFATMGVEDAFAGGSTQTINRLQATSTTAAQARYVKVEITNPGTLPDRPGVASWVFMDEMEVIYVGTTLEALEEVITATSNVNIEAYTEESAQAYIDAKANAKALVAAGSATSAQIDAAILSLQSAYDGLELARSVVYMTVGSKSSDGLVDDKYSPSYIHIDTEYIGWQNATTFEAVVDLGSVQKIDSVGFSSSSRPQWGIYPPNATVYVSDDYGTWTKVAYLDAPEHTLDVSTATGVINSVALDNVSGRYVRYVFENDDSHLKESVTAPGTLTKNEWVFIDEVIINDMHICKDKLQTLVEEVKNTDVSAYGDGANVFKNALNEAIALLAKEEAVVSAYQNAYEALLNAYNSLEDLAIIVYDKTLGKYGASGIYNILDGIYGSMEPDTATKQIFGNGTWAGIEGKDLTVTITLPEEVEFNQLSLGFLQEWKWGIRYPEYVTFYISEDGINYVEYDSVSLGKDFIEEASTNDVFVTDIQEASSKYFKIFIKNGGNIPAGHAYAGSPTWFFFDEFTYATVTDFRALDTLVDVVKSIDTDNYTEVSVDTLEKALKEAINVLENTEATQEEVDAAMKALEEAYDALVNVESLKDIINDVKDTNVDTYTEESVNVFKDALEYANAVIVDGTREEVEAAKEALLKAYDGLTVKEKETPETKDTTNVAGLLAILLASAYILTRKRKA